MEKIVAQLDRDNSVVRRQAQGAQRTVTDEFRRRVRAGTLFGLKEM